MKSHTHFTLSLFLFCCAFAVRAELSPEMARIMAAPVEVVKTHSFDTQLPGEWPREWFGNGAPIRAHELVAISNEESISAPNAMIVDSSHLQPNEERAYLRIDFPAVSNATACVFSFCFRLDEGNVTAEIRTNGKTWISHALAIQEALTVRGFGYDTGSAILGRIQRYTWYRVTFFLPTQENNTHRWAARLDTLQPDGSWSLGTPAECYAEKFSIENETYSAFDFSGGHLPAKFFVDDISYGFVR